MITRLIIEKTELFANGHEFPITGAYEKLVGRLYGEVDPKSRLNRIIVNLDKAPRNTDGRVEYWSDFCILKPVDMERGNGRIFFDAPNRGSKRIVAFLNDAPASNDPSTIEHAGNGFLMRAGYTLLWSAWNWDVLPGDGRLQIDLPVATDGGAPITSYAATCTPGPVNASRSASPITVWIAVVQTAMIRVFRSADRAGGDPHPADPAGAGVPQSSLSLSTEMAISACSRISSTAFNPRRAHSASPPPTTIAAASTVTAAILPCRPGSPIRRPVTAVIKMAMRSSPVRHHMC